MRRISAATFTLAAFAGILTPTKAFSATPVTCGQTLTASVTLASDLGPCPGDGLVIGADGITVDLGRHRVFASGDEGAGGQFVGIQVSGRRGVTVRNGTIERFEAGVVIENGGNDTIDHLVVATNVGPADEDNADFGDGILLLNTADNRVTNNTLRGNGRYDGIGVLGFGSDRNTLQANTVTDSVSFEPSFLRGVGILLDTFASFPAPPPTASIFGNRVISNVIRNNAGSGILSVASVDSVIQSNLIETNGPDSGGRGIGFSTLPLTTKATSARIVGNTVRNNGGPGLEVRSSSSNQVSANSVTGNHGLAGIVLTGPPDRTQSNQVERNAVHHNDGSGILVQDATMNQITHNDASDNALAPGAVIANDLRDENPGCDANRWFANHWGSGGFSPVCTSAR